MWCYWIMEYRKPGSCEIALATMERLLRLFTCILFSLILLSEGNVFAQSINAQDLSAVRIDDLSDAQILAYIGQAEASGLSEDEMEQMAIQRGLPYAEVVKLRSRVESLRGQEEVQYGKIDTRRPTNRIVTDTVYTSGVQPDSSITEEGDTVQSRIFGASLFQSSTPMFEPNLRIATPKSYVIGPGDQLLIDIYGQSEASHTLNVTPDGTINIPHLGVVPVAGMTIEQASSRIRTQLSSVYGGMRAGGTQVEIALGNIRSIHVVITGEVVRPGTFTLPSLASVFNALYQSGGPTANGSFRNVNLIRNGSTIAVLDIYDILVNGAFSENIRLEDQDVILIPPYSNRVELTGEVKREAIFELKEGETFEELLNYAGGFTEEAYRARVKVIKTTDREHRVEDLLSSQFRHYVPSPGDKFLVERVLPRYENRVSIEGAVFRPGDYELTPGLTLSMLIKKAEGVKEDAFLNRGSIARQQDDLQTERISFNVAGIIAGTEPDVELKREDVVNIYSIFDLQEARTVFIEGEVQRPGRFSYADGMTLQDLVVEAGGFRESASPMRVELSRRVRNINPQSRSSSTAEIFQIDVDQTLLKSSGDFVLMPFDEIVVRTALGYETQKTVRIEGEVLFPGTYTIMSKDERISDLVKRAGGFTAYAYIEGASLKRGVARQIRDAETAVEQAERESERDDAYNRMLTLQNLQLDANSAGAINVEKNINNNFVGIDLQRIVKNPGKRGDLILAHGDVITVPKELQTVKISGEVLAPSIAVYSQAKGFRQYISQAGGFSQQAMKKSAYVLYANGSVKGTSKFLFFNSYPEIKPGAEIFVPRKPARDPISPQQWLGMTTGLASLAAILLTIFR